MNYIGKWTKFEIAYLVGFSIIIGIVSLTFFDPIKPDWFNYLNIVSAVSGILCVILVAKKNILNFPIGIINVITYGYIAYVYHWNGSMILNWFIFFPFQFIGWYYWKNNLNNEYTEVKVKFINVNQFFIIGAALIIGITF
ncbi:MAG: nicotinamide riboside transporter PnuC, partial [Burkholderiales bacterium]|nr:nicotinamide riboside transporter PnuC [Burkholderiales bacterium]